jgi:uncharacterized protein
MNIDFMSVSPILVTDWSNNFTNSFDMICGKIKFVLLAQRFIGIFSLLFGLSIAIQKKNFDESGNSFNKYYFKRTGILIFFGLIHIAFFYMGDILIIYSILGLTLFLLFKLSNRTLIILACIIYFVPAILESLQYLDNFASNIKNYYTSETIKLTYQSGTFLEKAKARFIEYFYYDFTGLSWNRTSFAMMILGYIIGRNSFHKTYLTYWRKLKVVFIISFIFFVSFIVYCFTADIRFSFWLNFIYNLHILASIATYLFLALLVFQYKTFSGLNDPFINIGRMSLSNYLFQSIVCSFVFTNYGLSLFAKTSPTTNILIALTIFMRRK